MQECNKKYGERRCLDKIGSGKCPGEINDQCVSNIKAAGTPSELPYTDSFPFPSTKKTV